MNGLGRLCALAVSSVPLVDAFAQDGLFADFVTSRGSFTCQLHFERAPRTVANFAALAAGERAWLDLPTGAANRRPFYDRLTFHRVVQGFVIQGGSPKGDGTDGPGYTFRDEFQPTLRHNKAGILSMANSGPHSNGSQFFITLAATPHLDDVHSVFGEVTSGIEVVQTIGAVQTEANGRPLVPVVMQQVTIRRVGAAANSFDFDAQGLPSVGGASPKLVKSGSNFSLQFGRALASEYWLYHSSDLATWTRQLVGLYTSNAPPPADDLDVTSMTAGRNQQFFRVPQIAYPAPLFTPATLFSSQVRLNLGNGQTLDLFFNPTGGGTDTLTNSQGSSSGTIERYTWLQEAYRGQLTCEMDNVVPIVVSLVFATAGDGTFKGTAFTSPQQAIAGTFTFLRTAPNVAGAGPISSVSTSRVKATGNARPTRSKAIRR